METLRGTPPLVESLAAETREGADSYARFGDRLTRYAKARMRASAMADYIAAIPEPDEDTRKALRELAACGSYLVFRHYIESDRVRLHSMRSCRQHLVCPLCAIRRGARALARYLERFEIVMAESPHLVPYMVTLTIKNGPDLAERFAHVQRSIQALGKTRHRERQSSEFQKAEAAVYSYEFKRGSGSGEWHPHVHAVWLCNAPLDVKALSADWHRITGDSFIVNFHQMYGEPIDAFCEVFKYAVKFGDLPFSDNWQAYLALRRHQLMGSVGKFRGVHVPADLTDELLDEPEWVDLFFRYCRDLGRYEQINALPRPSPELLPGHDPLTAAELAYMRDSRPSGKAGGTGAAAPRKGD